MAARNETSDAGLAPALDQLRPDSEARREDQEPGKRGLGGQPVAPPGRTARHRDGPADHASGQHCRGPDRIAARCEAERWTGTTAARRTAGRLSPVGLLLATSITLTGSAHLRTYVRLKICAHMFVRNQLHHARKPAQKSAHFTCP